jgi:hypothetical protein
VDFDELPIAITLIIAIALQKHLGMNNPNGKRFLETVFKINKK